MFVITQAKYFNNTKKQIMTLKYNYIVVLMAAFMTIGCGSKKSISTEVTKPPIVSLDSSIERIGILDRSIPSEEGSVIDQIDQILSVEGRQLDIDGANQALVALKTTLLQNPRFKEVVIISTSLDENPGGGVFPSALSWDQIEDLRKANNVDAIFTLAMYDTDATTTYDVKDTTIKGPLGVEIPAVRHFVNITTKINSGWRMYDPVNKRISDELTVSERTSSSGSGINPVKALEAAKDRKQSVLQISQKIGSDYALRLMPYQGKIYRDYYVKSTPSFEVAKRKVETGQWEDAAAIWKKETSNTDPEIAGEACYNMAFYNEIKGDYTKAIEWATKSYTDYENRRALRYIDDLKERIDDQNIINQN